MRYPRVLITLFSGLAMIVPADTWAFAVPQPQQELIASKVAYVQLSAEEGSAEAQYLLGLMYVSGRFVNADKVLGVSWLKKSADNGSANAQKTLADLAFEGKLIKRDLSLAEHWYLKLADKDRWAQFRLGFIYAAGGDGVSRHCGKAVKYFTAAGDNVSMGNAAWILATCPEKQFRDGEKAVQLATDLLKTNEQDPTNLDNLAAAYAELGNFNEAVKAQRQAIAALQADKGKIRDKEDEFKSRLRDYLQHKPYREILPLD
ncbi:tetratricopeptide repeat protein [Shewanella yunxiaonensis]|uniref:tetratricopeptide repeat protein n=1 Tax=Shewanella yunxiaonensis TaxID=2829809 RepID=UPI001E2FED6A|nr:tetratricopeptide repeat protein [Shewanella yunxiaonensis]